MPVCGSKCVLRTGLILVLAAVCATGSMMPAIPAAAQSSAQPTPAEAARFLDQATWGPTPDSISHVQSIGYERFLEEQFAAPMSSYDQLVLVPATPGADCPAQSLCRRDNYTLFPVQTQFFNNTLYGEDQLRQRVAFALHQIFVVSGVNIGQGYPSRFTYYLLTLDADAFGNFRQLLYDITLNPAMGTYLNMANNKKGAPNENYGREVLQLFTIGLNRLNPDGSPVLDGQGHTIPTYDQTVVTAFARVFTGWTFAPPQDPTITNYIDPMYVATEANHDTAQKTLLRGVTLPANQTAGQDLNDALDNIFQDPNMGPFIGRQLIQNLVTSNPSPAYIARITNVFNNNGSGVRGDLQAVVKAILLDPEARNQVSQSGRLMHPVLLMTKLLRAFNAGSADGTGQSDGYLDPQSAGMGMDVFSPPSVFSYFSPFGAAPGTTLRGPEFGLLNTSTAISRANFVERLVFSGIPANVDNYPFNPSGTSLDFSAVLPLAGNPQLLVDTLNTLMMSGRMSSAMNTAVVTAVQAVASSNPLKQVRTAVYLIATSSQYQVER
jgi:uncharacterized protein (DUF1800 family)